MKKKIFAVVLALVLMMAMFVSPASAATKADLIKAVKNDAILGNYPHIINLIVNQMDNFSFTSEQCDYLLEKFAEAQAIVAPEGDKGESAHSYDPVVVEQIVDLVAEVVTELGYTYAYIPSQNPFHVGDFVLQVYDADGVVLFEFDGDYVKHTDEAASSVGADVWAYTALGGGVALIAVAVFFAIKGKKSVNEIEA
ncbi:MAG: hypothetical protein IKY44_02925 [Clostridia bacterium]|nr:hypothetical protein [Clostridia bacterium]